ncbi:unnamed protein product, partial [Discosporangium mesarthrocarpum]
EQEARDREDEIVADFSEDFLFEDPDFPPDGKSLYRTPQQTPRGAMPPPLIRWGRVSRLEVRGCHSPTTFPEGDRPLCGVLQGALGDKWLMSAFNILLSTPQKLRQLIVSERHKDKGIYTIKIFKEGAWRYMHVDDCLPCSQAGALHYCHPMDLNQVWGPLIEKAFAKLHGCYENLGRHSVERGLRALAGTPVLR